MNAVIALYRSTIGKKVAMAISGLVYVGWVLFHLAGNLQFHLGPEYIDGYAHKFQSMPPLVWSGRLFLLAALLVHVVSAFSLIARNNGARGKAYKQRKNQATTAAAMSMRFGGIALLLFIIFHMLDFTVGVLGPVMGLVNFYDHASLGFVRGEVYHNMLVSFGSPIGAGIYILATVFLSLHLFHGAWSAIQTLGFTAATTEKLWRNVAAFVAGLVLIGNLSFPIMGLAGTIGGFLEGPLEFSHCQDYGSCPDQLAVTDAH